MTQPPPALERPHRLTEWGWPALVFAVVLAANLMLLDAGPLARTEGLRALVAHEMAQGGDWIVPTLFGDPYLRKPPLHTWLLAGTQRLLGQGNELVWRLPAAITTAGLAAFLCVVGRAWFGAVAGPVTGFSFLTLVALWSQNRSAEIDGPFTAFSVVAALAVLRLTQGPGARQGRWMVVGGLALGAALLAKGPALVPLLLGAWLGPIVANRLAGDADRPGAWRTLGSPRVWGVLAIGVGLFGVWALAAWMKQTAPAAEAQADSSGLVEVLNRLQPRWDKWRAAVMPLEMLLYAAPLSLLLPLGLMPSRIGLRGRGARLVRGSAAAFVGAVIASALLLVIRPRYIYLALPLLCPLAGAVAQAWHDGRVGEPLRRPIRAAMTVVVVVVLGVQLVLSYLAATLRLEHPPLIDADVPAWFAPPLVPTALLLTWSLAAAALAVLAVVKLLAHRVVSAAWALLGLLLAASVAFNAYKAVERYQRSPYLPGLQMRQVVGDAGTVTALWTYRDNPDLFHYAGVGVRTLGAWPPDPFPLERPQWIVFDQRRWLGPVTENGTRDASRAWSVQLAGRFAHVTELAVDERGWPRWYLAYYTPGPAAPGSASSK